MKDFIAEIKRINTDGVIFEFSKASIDMFQRQQYQKTFEVLSTRFGIQKKVGVSLSAWDIQDIAYLAVLHSNDYRRGKNLPQMGYLINLYRGYENANSIAEELRKSNIDRIFRAILGMSAEQFQYENINWIFEKFNRDYYILLAADDFDYALSPEEVTTLLVPGTGFVYAPVAQGQTAGYAYVCLKGKTVGKIPLLYGLTVEQKTAPEPSFWQKLFGGREL